MDSLFGKADVSELPLVAVQVDADGPLHVPVQPRLIIFRDWKPGVFFEGQLLAIVPYPGHLEFFISFLSNNFGFVQIGKEVFLGSWLTYRYEKWVCVIQVYAMMSYFH